MTVYKRGETTKRLGAGSLGSKIIHFKVSSLDRRFAVHEDLICRTSTLFKSKLQKNRKTLAPHTNGEDCCVCYEALNPITKDITYCITCGQNVHENCIERWKCTPNQQSGDRPLPTCPMCRATWKNEPLVKNLNLNNNNKLDAEAVQTYLDWLYSVELRIPTHICRKTDTFNTVLLKCWAVAEAVGDDAFKSVVITTFFNEAKARLWSESIKWAFVDDHASEDIRSFVIEVFLAFMKPGWFKKEGRKWPNSFVSELADKILERCKGKKSYADVKREWLGRLEKGREG